MLTRVRRWWHGQWLDILLEAKRQQEFKLIRLDRKVHNPWREAYWRYVRDLNAVAVDLERINRRLDYHRRKLKLCSK